MYRVWSSILSGTIDSDFRLTPSAQTKSSHPRLHFLCWLNDWPNNLSSSLFHFLLIASPPLSRNLTSFLFVGTFLYYYGDPPSLKQLLLLKTQNKVRQLTIHKGWNICLINCLAFSARWRFRGPFFCWQIPLKKCVIPSLTLRRQVSKGLDEPPGSSFLFLSTTGIFFFIWT